jgi:chemotaxis response regulator CheB
MASRDDHLAELLSKTASIPMIEAKNATELEPNHVYVIPTNVARGILQGRLPVRHYVYRRELAIDNSIRTTGFFL